MDWFARALLKSSLAWLAAGVTLGVVMAAHPAWSGFRIAHEHMNLLGFVAMMIYGVAYHVIPRFTGVPLHSRRMAGVHVWVANTGLATMVAGFCLRASGVGPIPVSTGILACGGTLSALSAYLFVYNIWKTIDGKPPANVIPMRRAG